MPQKDASRPSEWVDKYADALFSYSVARVSDRETARDLVQETFLSALQNVDTFRGDSSEKTWLFAILKNKIVDHFRRATADPRHAPLEDDSHELNRFFDDEGEWKESEGPSDWSVNPHRTYRAKEFQGVLERCLATLKAQWRAIFTLKYLEDLDSEEICKELAISPSNYWVIMHRAKLVLRRCIEKNWLRP